MPNDPVLNGVKLVVALGGLAAKPGLLTALKTGTSVHDTLKKMLAQAPPSLASLADTLAADAQATLDGFARDLSADAPILYEQMVIAALPDAPALVAGDMDPARITTAMLASHTDPEHRRAPMPALFRDITEPTFARLLADKSFADDLTPAFMARVLGDLSDQSAKLDALPDQIVAVLRREGVIPATDGDTVPLTDLARVAKRFGDPPEGSPADFLAFLRDKAADMSRLAAEIEAMRGTSERIDNIAAQAAAAVERGDLDDARQLLDGAREIQKDLLRKPLEANAALMEKTAEIDLIEGKVEDAYHRLSRAADSFAGIDVTAGLVRRLEYGEMLRAHGYRYGGSGLALAIETYRPVRDRTSPSDQPKLWANATVRIGRCHQELGVRLAGAEGNNRLGRAVSAYRDALDVYTPREESSNWATTQNNLGNALWAQGTRTAGPDGASLLAEAVDAYRAALTVRTEAEHPVHWAMTQNNLGTALQDQGTRTGGADGTRLLAEAVAAYRAALTVYTEAKHPVDWATTQNNLGNALWAQGTRTGGPDGASLLAEAVDAYRAALTVRTEAEHPVDWAMTQNNLGAALQDQGTRTGGADGTRLLAEAVAAYRAALTVYTEAKHPVDWAMTQNNLGAALGNQGTRTGGADGTRLLAEAVAAYRAALTVRTEAEHPVQWAMTQENLAIAEQAIADHDATADPRPHLEAALRHVEAALTVFDPEHMPYNFEKATKLRDALRARLDP